jgi:hypothetical protein
MHNFWDGFEKRASSLVGAMPGLTSGLRTTSKAGKIRMARPVSGESIGPRVTPIPTPGPRPISPAAASNPAVPTHKSNVKIPKPKQSSRGVSSTTI